MRGIPVLQAVALALIVLLIPYTGLALFPHCMEAELLSTEVSKADRTGISVNLAYEGTRIGAVTLSYKGVRGTNLTYDALIAINIYEDVLDDIIGRDHRVVTILEYELEVNGTTVSGYRFSSKARTSYTITGLAGVGESEGYVEIDIVKLNVIVNLYSGNWTLVAYTPIDLKRILEDNGLPLTVIAGSYRAYFWVKTRKVDPYWVTYQIYSWNGILVGSVKVTSQGPFNYSTATRIYYESYDPILPNNAKLLLVMSVETARGGIRTIKMELAPGEDFIMPPELESMIGENVSAIKSLEIIIDSTVYREVVNVTRDVGEIVFNPIKPVIREFTVSEVSVDVVGDGLVRAVYKLPFEVGPNDLRLEFTPSRGSMAPVLIIGALEFDGLTGEELLRVYMVFPGRGVASGTLTLKVERAPGKAEVAKTQIGPLEVEGAPYKIVKLEPMYSTLVGGGAGLKSIADVLREEGLIREYKEFGGASYLYIGIDTEKLTPLDAIALTLNVTYERIDPAMNVRVLVVPIYDYITWSPQVDSMVFLLNGTSQGSTVIEGDGPVVLNYIIPVASIVGYSPEGVVAGESYPVIRLRGIGLIFLNARDLRVNNLDAYILKYTGQGASELSYLRASVAASLGAALSIIYRFKLSRRLNGLLNSSVKSMGMATARILRILNPRRPD